MRKLSNPVEPRTEQNIATREISVAELLGGDREVVLVHRGERYRLRVTANGKLLLTK